MAVAIVNYNDEVAIPKGLSLNLLDVGFSVDTRVAVYDVYEEAGQGWHTYTFTTGRVIPPHGVMLLKLSYSPQYTSVSDEL
jgi:hypothetical protein